MTTVSTHTSWPCGASAFRLLLEHGQPAAFPAVAAEAGVDVSTGIDVLHRFETRGNARLSAGMVVGIAGLSVEPTAHRIELSVGRRWTWCAIDAVGIVGAVGDGIILSETTDGPVEIHVGNGELVPSDLAVFIADGYGMTSSVDEWCPVVNFFPTLEAVAAWMEQAGVRGKAVTVSSIGPEVIARWQTILAYSLAPGR